MPHSLAQHKVYRIDQDTTKPTKQGPTRITGKDLPRVAVAKPVAPVYPIRTLPPEIQLMIWSFTFPQPACHTFKLQKQVELNPHTNAIRSWDVIVKPPQWNHDHSMWRHWKKLHSLRNYCFEEVIRAHTTDLLPVDLVLSSGETLSAAAMDVATDLVIFEFDRTKGSKEVEFCWFEHVDLMRLMEIRSKFSNIKKVAIHYKHAHVNCMRPCPFACGCPYPRVLGCDQLSCCPHEVACFLDCFPDLEQFYIITEQRLAAEKLFATKYRNVALMKNFRFHHETEENGGNVVKTYDVARFFDTRYEYLQLLPPAYSPQAIYNSPFRTSRARHAANMIRRIYRSDIMDEPFHNTLAQRQRVKFGILVPYENKDVNGGAWTHPYPSLREA